MTDLPLIEGSPSHERLTDVLFAHVWQKTPRWWTRLFLIGLAGTGMLTAAITITISRGVGTWGNNIPVAWAFGIVNFVWWIGIGHAGTLISAILLLFQQKWRTSINRFAEAMTLFAVVNAGLYPILHLGRPWFAYWLIPYPSTLRMWPQFKSPLVWDVFAISTYLTVSFLFWYLGLVPDLAALRDTSKKRAQQVVYGIFSLGWRGSAKHWHHYKVAYLLLAGLATPLVLSVHTIVSFDFAASILPGWHTTIFPPFFVAGAVFSGFAMVVTLLVPARRYLGLKEVVTLRHLDNMNKVILVTGLMVAYGYVCEHFIAWYSGNEYEKYSVINRATGPYAPIYWLMIACNVILPNFYWSKRARTNVVLMWVISLFVNVGMWTERFVIVAVSLHRDFLPSSWRLYRPTWVDFTLFGGTLCFFGTLFLLFLRFLPAVSVTEVKELADELRHEAEPRRSTVATAPGVA